MSGDNFGWHSPRVGGAGAGATGFWWVESLGAAKHPSRRRTAPHYKELSAHIVDSVEVERSRLGLSFLPTVLIATTIDSKGWRVAYK